MVDTIIVLDFGSQYAQLIARRVRELKVYCELHPWNQSPEKIHTLNPKGFILSGGPLSIYDEGAPYLADFVLETGVPVLGICYGMQALAAKLSGEVQPSRKREYGQAVISKLVDNPLILEDKQAVWMSHGDRITNQPKGWTILAASANSPIAVMADLERRLYGLQFHPEVRHTPNGNEILRRFVIDICDCQPDWTPQSIIEKSVADIQKQVGAKRVLSAVSGGVDSSVATALVQKAVGDQLSAVFIDNGLLRQDERQQVEQVFLPILGEKLIIVDAADHFLKALKGIVEPEQKRQVIGETFIRVFEAIAKEHGNLPYLVQGTIYPDVVESSSHDTKQAHRIKTHHNVGGLPSDMRFELVEPLRYLFKDEVRIIGEELGLPKELVWRQPFPGPGLAVRCLGEVTFERLVTLRQADAIFNQELERAGLLEWTKSEQHETGTSQAFTVLLPVKAVGVMGDQRSYQEVVALRAVTTDDFMTADWAKLPYELLGRVASRIVNEVHGVNRVVYDITSKPPATIEWE